jgi:hypothetical protein
MLCGCGAPDLSWASLPYRPRTVATIPSQNQMTRQNLDPSSVASRYRVKKLEDREFDLVASVGNLPNIKVRRASAAIYLMATPKILRWHADASRAFYAAQFVIGDLDIGHRGDEGWSSPLVDNCFFVIDGETLRHIPFLEVRIVVEDQYQFEKMRNAANRGEKPSSQSSDASSPPHPIGDATIVHCSAVPEYGIDEVLACTVGLPYLHFEKLVNGCLNGRVSSISFHGSGGALSSSFQYGSARDVIFCLNGNLEIRIDSLTIDSQV